VPLVSRKVKTSRRAIRPSPPPPYRRPMPLSALLVLRTNHPIKEKKDGEFTSIDLYVRVSCSLSGW